MSEKRPAHEELLAWLEECYGQSDILGVGEVIRHFLRIRVPDQHLQEVIDRLKKMTEGESGLISEPIQTLQDSLQQDLDKVNRRSDSAGPSV